jgi:hypothetical protein
MSVELSMRKMRSMRTPLMLFVIALAAIASCKGQAWAPLLNASQAIDWSASGVGSIPPRPIICATLSPSVTANQINAALLSCPAGQTVFLEAGTYSIAGSVSIPSNVTLRGAGADLTTLNSAIRDGEYIVSLGAGSVPFRPRVIMSGAV